MGGDSRFVVDEQGNKWRLCSGVAVLNSCNELLIGERIQQPGSWQAPQGGVDEGESVVEAAHRELYEETGLLLDKHVMLEKLDSQIQIQPTCYGTGSTNCWLTRNGFSGQQLHWTVYRCIDGLGDKNAEIMCSLEGKNGEPQEFTKVKWAPIDQVVEKIWPAKRAAYEQLSKCLLKIKDNWAYRLLRLDFSGKWSREASLCVGVAKLLQARGMSASRAEEEASLPFTMKWSRKTPDDITWKATEFHKDTDCIKCERIYNLGEWETECCSDSTLFEGNKESPTVLCRTAYVSEPTAHPENIAHVTIYKTHLGLEEARTYLQGEVLVLRRKLWPTKIEEQIQLDACIISTELFCRV